MNNNNNSGVGKITHKYYLLFNIKIKGTEVVKIYNIYNNNNNNKEKMSKKEER